SALIIAPGLRLDPAHAETAQVRELTRELIATLLNAEMPRQQLHESLLSERVLTLEAFEQRSQGTWFIKPLATQAKLTGLEAHRMLIAAAAYDNLPQTLESLQEMPVM